MMKKFQILFEDEDIFVVVKPSGILSQGDRSNSPDMVSMLKGYVLLKLKREGKKNDSDTYVAVIHRLDKMVRGIMVYAKSKKAAASLSESLKSGEFVKTYLAIVDRKEHDELKQSEDFTRLTSFFYYDKINNLSLLSKEKKGDICISDYRVVKLVKQKALIEVRLITGRKHQIRLQMTELSNGIQGDKKYNVVDEKRTNSSIALECVHLSFPHPISGERLSFSIEPQIAVL